MDTTKIHPTYFGSRLEESISVVHAERKPLIESFLYEKSALLLYADDGVGKSVLTLQACMQATIKESKVFGEFLVPQPRKILYFQMERHPDETFERMRHMRRVIPFDTNSFALSTALQGTNLQNAKLHADALTKLVDIVDEVGFIPDIVAFDPIYTLAQDGLEKAESCNAITSFFRIVQLYLNCAIIATSHTNRGVRDFDNPNNRVGKDMYGNRFLSAFFTGSYHIKDKNDGAGTEWRLGKNSQKNLEKNFELMYDHANYQSIYLSDGKFSKKDKLDNFLKACKTSQKEFSFSDMQSNSQLSDSVLRGYLIGYLEKIITQSSKGSHGKILYKCL